MNDDMLVSQNPQNYQVSNNSANLGAPPLTTRQNATEDDGRDDNFFYFKKHCKLLVASALFGILFTQIYINKFQKKDVENVSTK